MSTKTLTQEDIHDLEDVLSRARQERAISYRDLRVVAAKGPEFGPFHAWAGTVGVGYQHLSDAQIESLRVLIQDARTRLAA